MSATPLFIVLIGALAAILTASVLRAGPVLSPVTAPTLTLTSD